MSFYYASYADYIAEPYMNAKQLKSQTVRTVKFTGCSSVQKRVYVIISWTANYIFHHYLACNHLTIIVWMTIYQTFLPSYVLSTKAKTRIES